MAEDRIEIDLEEGEEEASPAPLIINLEDLPSDEEIAALQQPRDGGAAAYPGLVGPVPTGLQVTAHCAAREADFVLSLSPLPNGGYLVRPLPKGASGPKVGNQLTVQGPFFAEKGNGCPHCGAEGFLVCQCGAVSCHKGGRFARCPACRRRLIVKGSPDSLQARGFGKGK